MSSMSVSVNNRRLLYIARCLTSLARKISTVQMFLFVRPLLLRVIRFEIYLFQACLLKELKSTEDGHEEYYMTCAPKQVFGF